MPSSRGTSRLAATGASAGSLRRGSSPADSLRRWRVRLHHVGPSGIGTTSSPWSSATCAIWPHIASLDVLPRLLSLAASHSARLLNVSDLAAPFQLSRPTIKDAVTLLEQVFLLETLAPWHSNRLSRLIKTPKLHLGDTGVVCALLGLDAESLREDRQLLGQLLETFVFQELRRQASWHEDDVRFHHFRDKDGAEVDLVLEYGGRALAGIEVKAAATVTAADFRGLRKLRDAAEKRFAIGGVLYDGEASVSFGDGMYAVPIRALWELV